MPDDSCLIDQESKEKLFFKWMAEEKYYPPCAFKQWREEYILFRKSYKLCFNCKNLIKKELCTNTSKAYFCPDCSKAHKNYKNKVNLRRRATCIERYGTDSVSKLDEVKHIKLTKLKEKSEEELAAIKEKSKQTQIQKYGMLYSQTEEYKNKIKNTSLEKYGYDSPNKCPHIKKLQIENQKKSLAMGDRNAKTRETCLKKYGAPWYSCTKEFRDNYHKSFDAKLGVINGNISHLMEHAELKSGVYIFDKEKISKKYNVSYHSIRRVLNKSGIKWQFKSSKALQESDFLDEVEKYIKIERQYKIKFNKSYAVADGFDPKGGIVIEYLGDYWHGNPKVFKESEINENTKESFGKLYNKTSNRFEDISNLGYEIFYIWESDWKSLGLKGLRRFEKGKQI